MVGSMVEKRNQQGAVLDMSVEIIQIIIHVSKKGKKKKKRQKEDKKSLRCITGLPDVKERD